MRRILVLVLAALLSAPAAVCALGLGNIETRSGLNEPFSARIPLIKATADELDNLKVQLADPAAFQRAGIDLTSVLMSLRFEVKQSGKGPDYIQITTHDPVREPFLNFLVEIDWSKGRLVREYTVLLDPPLYQPARPAAIQPAATSANAPAAPSVSAAAPSPSGHAPPSGTTATGGGVASGSVAPGDTLWSMAGRMRPDPSVSIQQMMIALLRANPDAFAQGNINGLKKGYVLKMPAQGDIVSISKDEALAEVKKQYSLWEQFRETAAKNVPAEPEGPTAGSETGAPQAETGGKAASTGEAHLKLLSTKEGAARGNPAQELALAKETLDSKEQENADLKSQLVESEQIIEKLKSRVALQDDQLAALQAKLSGMQPQPAAMEPAPVPAPAPATQPAPPAPMPEAKPAAPAATEVKPAAPAVPEAKPAAPPKMAPAEKPAVAAKPAPTGPAATLKSIEDQIAAVAARFVPKALLDTIPGGVLTLLGAAVAIVLVLIGLIVKLAGRSGTAAPARRMPAAGRADEASEATQFDEPVTETREEEDQTATPFNAGSTTQLEVTQIAASRPAAAAPEAEEDPLAEVNVYLAYERFDEAEKVVKDAIARFPAEHKYKLRLLEVYYSSNNKAAYEHAARDLYDAVGGSGPLWDSAVAMWREMSPDRDLFAARDDDTTLTAKPATPERQFVDITAGDEQPPEMMSSTVSAAPGEPSAAMSSTGGGLDFDLGTGAGAGETGGDVLDLTAGSAENMLDITSGASLESAAAGEVLDLTARSDEQEPAAVPSLADLEDTVDKFSKASTDDLLDVTKTGDISPAEHGDLLNVTAPGTLGEGAGDNVLDITGGNEPHMDEHVIEFDLGGSLGPEAPAADEGIVDITAGDLAGSAGEIDITAPAHDDNVLEFDIGALEPAEGAGGTHAATEELDTLNLDEAMSAMEKERQDIEREMKAEAPSGGGLEIDLGEDSLSMLSKPEPSGDDTMDLNAEDLSLVTDDMSLDDLTKSLEDTLTGLKKSADTAPDMGELSFDLGEEGAEAAGTPHMSTLEMAPDLEAAAPGSEKTVVMPRSDSIESQSANDEVDTKLNLAKAYIELGDSAGARTILNEVVAEGSAAQQDEARRLLRDMG